MTAACVGLIFLAVALTGCDEPSSRRREVPPRARQVEIDVVATLGLDEGLAYTLADDGDVYWCQGDDRLVYRVGADGLPSGSGLTTDRLAAALGLPPTRWAALTGSFQTLAAVGDEMFFFFLGALDDRETVAVLGKLDASGQVVSLLTTERLETESTLGGTLTLAEAQLVHTEQWIWLWLRVPGEVVVLRFHPQQTQVRLDRPFTSVRVIGEDDLRLFLPDVTVSAGPDDTLLVKQPARQSLWRVEMPTGQDRAARATLLVHFTGLPAESAATTAMGRPVVLLAGPEVEAPPGLRAQFVTPLPAVAWLRPDGVDELFADDRLRAGGGVDLATLRPAGLTAAAGRQLLTFDRATGSLLRLTLPAPAE